MVVGMWIFIALILTSLIGFEVIDYLGKKKVG
ncbi:hypothetical protein SAMN06265339_0694 [Desulfurobacterium pacificum]|uniref:Uncharacterized protein n=1 Tax=Desulfurobacterium pacificum TaxID=240166 RepID=A0ABY1NGJ7_9BACT|nr:hypothetical protein SAMN06265339_0694 [Desulfurobacterium pacificum]